jgi:hypothetical protein
VRIDGNSRINGASYAAIGKRAGISGSFTPEIEVAAAKIAGGAPIASTTDIDALLAIQSMEDTLFARKKAIRRGRQMLDALDGVKGDLLAGIVSEGRLNQLLALVGQAREQTVPGLDSVLDDVELRARVELAKFGRFSAA